MDTNIALFYSHSILTISPSQQSRFNIFLSMATLLKDSCNEGERLLSGFTNLIGDCWFAFFAQEPHIKVESRQSDTMHFNFIQNLLTNEQYRQWHHLTKGDELLSVLTAIAMADQLIKSLENIKRAQSNQTSLKNNFQSYIQNINQQKISSMIEHNKDKIHNTRKAIITVGTMDGKKIDYVPLKDQFELAEKISKHKELQKIAHMVGRFKRIAMQKQKAKTRQTMERNNITIGQEVARLLPTELASYILPHSNLDFLRRYVEQQTFIFDTKGKDKKGMGPIIICMDESSSMTSLKEQSKAFCIALLTIAIKQKRDFAIVPFASQVGDVMIFKKGHATTQEIIHFSNQFLTGGTNYEHPLRESLKILTQSEFNEADILFVTDGSSFLSSRFIEEFNEVKRKKQFECTAIVLTNLFNAVDFNLINKFSDRIIEVGELFEAHDAFMI